MRGFGNHGRGEVGETVGVWYVWNSNVVPSHLESVSLIELQDSQTQDQRDLPIMSYLPFSPGCAMVLTTAVVSGTGTATCSSQRAGRTDMVARGQGRLSAPTLKEILTRLRLIFHAYCLRAGEDTAFRLIKSVLISTTFDYEYYMTFRRLA